MSARARRSFYTCKSARQSGSVSGVTSISTNFHAPPCVILLIVTSKGITYVSRLGEYLKHRLCFEKMGLKVESCNESDMARVFEIISDTFGQEEPFVNAVYPSHSTVAGRKMGASRMLNAMKNDPCTAFVKAVDEDTGEIVAQAKWNIYRNTIPDEGPLSGDFWENEEEKRYAQLLSDQFLIPRRKMIRETGGNLLCK